MSDDSPKWLKPLSLYTWGELFVQPNTKYIWVITWVIYWVIRFWNHLSMTNPIQTWKGYDVMVECSRMLKNIPGSARYYWIYLSSIQDISNLISIRYYIKGKSYLIMNVIMNHLLPTLVFIDHLPLIKVLVTTCYHQETNSVLMFMLWYWVLVVDISTKLVT
jgi:hypothetical protein